MAASYSNIFFTVRGERDQCDTPSPTFLPDISREKPFPRPLAPAEPVPAESGYVDADRMPHEQILNHCTKFRSPIQWVELIEE